MPGFCSLLLASFSREEGRGEVAVVTRDRERALDAWHADIERARIMGLAGNNSRMLR